MSYMFSDAELQRAAVKLREARLALQNPPEGFNPEFSPRFEQAIGQLMRKGPRRAIWRKAASIAACILLIFVIGASVTLVVSPQARAAVINWIREQYENSIIYCFWGSDDEELEFPTYQIGWLPDGLTLERTVETENLHIAVYKLPDGTGIVFEYILSDERGATEIYGDTENSEVLSICGMYAEYVPSKDGTNKKSRG